MKEKKYFNNTYTKQEWIEYREIVNKMWNTDIEQVLIDSMDVQKIRERKLKQLLDDSN